MVKAFSAVYRLTKSASDESNFSACSRNNYHAAIVTALQRNN